MLSITEHFEYYNSDHLEAFKKINEWSSYFTLNKSEDIICFQADEERKCIELKLGSYEIDNTTHYDCEISSSYYVGLDLLPKLGFPVYIEPKLNTDGTKINYVEMLLNALTEPDNFNHLEGLLETKFEEKWIEIENHLQPLLTPFLMAQFLSVVKDIVRKGLKKSYYKVEEDLNNRIKGKILVGKQIKNNLLKNRLTKTRCEYQEFGFDTESNQFLKFILSQIRFYLVEFYEGIDFKVKLIEILNYCSAAFQNVSDRDFTQLKHREKNLFYKNYNQAIELGNQILALKDYNISKNANTGKCMHPPFWIDMSKLFELYVFKRLREAFPGNTAIQYHRKVNRQELDFIINTDKMMAVVDAKYKPRYERGNPSMDDARQLAGYTRLNEVYKELNIEDDRIIPAYFIYPENLYKFTQSESGSDIITDVFKDYDNHWALFYNRAVRISTTYRQMYMQEIDLPLC